VAGALAGITYGAASISAAWMDALRGKGVIEACLFIAAAAFLVEADMDHSGDTPPGALRSSP
jgi:hypothetical protein